jgi:maltooligosyltrehalose trehalohydrolase
MHKFRVWAPLVKQVEVQTGAARFPMVAGANGWWTKEAASAQDGGDYGFILDGKGPFPDPRSAFQPTGIDGLSRIVDHGKFVWTDRRWQAPPLSSAVIYELHIGTFTPQGTFSAAIEKLDHLVALGITHVELMPVNEFSGLHGWGYDGVDLFAPHHTYGGPEGLKKLVNACHERGLAVLLDVVYNHLGPAGNYLGQYAPYFTQRHASPWGPALNFDDADCEDVRRFFCDNALMWLRDYHFDGLRLDAVHAIIDASAVPFLEQLAVEVKRLGAELGRHLVLIAESDLNDPRLLWSRDRGGFGLDAQWSDDFHHALHSLLSGERNGYFVDFGSFANLDKALRQAFVLDGGYCVHRRRPHGRRPDGLSGDRFLGYFQNHDQAGNRAQGERSGRLMSPGRLRIAAALVMTSPFIPLLFQGEEWGASTPFLYFTDHADKELGEAVRQGRRREFAAAGWNPDEIPDPQAVETFTRSKLDWLESAMAQHADLLEWHRKLIQLRFSEPALKDGRMDRVQTRYDESERWLVVKREPIIVACNLGDKPRKIDLPPGQYKVLLTSHFENRAENGKVWLLPDSVMVLKRDKAAENQTPVSGPPML